MTAPIPPAPVRIDPAAVYTIAAVVLELDIPSATIRGAIRRGTLPAVRRGNRTYISGRDLLTWLTPPASAAPGARGVQPCDR